MPGKAPRQKGDRFERAIVKLFQEFGIAAERCPLSGSAGGSFDYDLRIPVYGHDAHFECKAKADGFKFLYDSLGENFGLFVKADRREPLVVMEAGTFASLLRVYERYRTIANRNEQDLSPARPRVRHGEEGE